MHRQRWAPARMTASPMTASPMTASPMTASPTATSPDKEQAMFALLKDVPVINNPVFRIVLGAALIVIAVALLHDNIFLIAIGALILIMGLVHGFRSLTTRTQNGEAR